MLDDLEHSHFLYFWEQANPQTGLIKDRCNVRATDTSVAASIASTGFGLTAICIAEKRGFVSYQDAHLRVIASLRFLWQKMPTHRGFFSILPTSGRGSAYGIPKSPPLTLQSCSAES